MKYLTILAVMLLSTAAMAGGTPTAPKGDKDIVVAKPSPAASKGDDGNFYLTVQGGAGFRDDDNFSAGKKAGKFGFDTGEVFTAEFGRKYDNGIKAGVELGYQKNDLDGIAGHKYCPTKFSGDWTTYTAMLNTYYEFEDFYNVSPYIGLGGGIANHHVDVSVFGVPLGDSDTSLVYNASAGASYPITDRLSATGGYRYLDGQDPKFGGIEVDYSAHQIRGGLSYKLY